MKLKKMKKIIRIGILFTLIFISCKSSRTFYQNQKIIVKACDLNNRINDTIVVSGIYSNCMEYSSFNLIENDTCYEKFNMDLNLNNVELSSKLKKRFNDMLGCEVSMRMILKGVLRKNTNTEYGHLGTNNAEFEVLKFLNYGKVKYHNIE
jgi:hypothetical protein